MVLQWYKCIKFFKLYALKEDILGNTHYTSTKMVKIKAQFRSYTRDNFYFLKR